ncbi:MAG: holin [Bacilli bacterium]|nr:holin [Bacilli bacterium]
MWKNCVFKNNVDTIKWMKSTIVRCIRTFASTMLALLPTTYSTLGSVDWKITFSSAALSTIIIFFSCLAGIPEVEEEKNNE